MTDDVLHKEIQRSWYQELNRMTYFHRRSKNPHPPQERCYSVRWAFLCSSTVVWWVHPAQKQLGYGRTTSRFHQTKTSKGLGFEGEILYVLQIDKYLQKGHAKEVSHDEQCQERV